VVLSNASLCTAVLQVPWNSLLLRTLFVSAVAGSEAAWPARRGRGQQP